MKMKYSKISLLICFILVFSLFGAYSVLGENQKPNGAPSTIMDQYKEQYKQQVQKVLLDNMLSESYKEKALSEIKSKFSNPQQTSQSSASAPSLDAIYEKYLQEEAVIEKIVGKIINEHKKDKEYVTLSVSVEKMIK